MMNLLVLILFFNLLGSLVSLSGGILLLVRKNLAYRFSHFLASFAAGTLLGTVFFDLLPEAVHEAEDVGHGLEVVFVYTLGGILFFFLLERFLHWFHHHGYEEHLIKGKPIIPLLIIGDTIHNFIDGIAITATFLVSIPAGIVTTLAVGAHEIPQEIGDFGIMLKHNLSWKKILSVNVLSAGASFVGVFLAYYYGVKVEGLSVIFISIAAGFFLYIALSDLIPEIHHENRKGLAFWETICLFLGVVSIYFALFFIREVLQIGH
ncbi:MAG: ZIP family metal transporter [Candidatus Levybacteria bacterium]|nr:ZIP family metal transporter [Candidatus Levybacteria bacterium]